MIAKDYSFFKLHGQPRQGQSLGEVKELLLSELNRIKNGQFDDWMLAAIIKNFKLDDQKRNESNSYRARKMTDAFILDQNWETVVNQNKKLTTLTTNDIIAFANKYFNNNYILLNKLHGTPNSIKVTKPKITTVPLNRDTSSQFAFNFQNIPSKRMQPIFNNYNSDVREFKLKNNIPAFYVRNTTNEIFSLSYILDMGKFSDKELALAVNYLEYLGTDKYNANQIEQEMFKLGLSYSVYASNERIYVQLSGLEESLETGVKLFEHILSSVIPNQYVYDNMVLDIIRERQDTKLSKWSILSGMRSYAKYGPKNPFNNIISSEDLQSIDIEKLTNKIKSLTKFKHYVYYYGRKNLSEIETILNKYHSSNKSSKNILSPMVFSELDNMDNKVYFIDYDMVQSEITMMSKGPLYNIELIPFAKLFNEYFGSGLSSIIFQEIRESKALAYSAWSSFSTPMKTDDSHYITAYLGTQVDKLDEATSAILKLMSNMPKSEGQFLDAKIAALKKIETSRTKRSRLFWNYLLAKDLGLDYDLNKEIYPLLENIEFTDLKSFFDNNIKDRNYTFLVIGNKDFVDHNALKKLGVYKELKLEEVFGY